MNPRPVLVLLFIGSLFLAGCSENEPKTEPEPVSSKAEQVGKEAAEAIKTPIEQADAVSGMQNAHNQALEEQAKSQ
ncbi:MAG: hypothetical protein F9K32_06800 [Desulfobulbaceae bacterium]|nr:MAG: hypothetical protein F9K32_06800 [Desulfobulbaceae bacterium]